MTDEEMLARAREKLNPVVRGQYCATGFVSALIEGKNGKYYAGVNIDLACGLGFCAERAAAAFCLGGGLTKTLAELLPLPWEDFGR